MMRWNRCENVLSVHNVSNLALKWSYTTSGEIANLISPTVANGVVYVTSYDGMLYALDAHTGAMLWNYDVGFSVSSPAILHGVVYVGAGDYNVYALNARSGAKLWSYTTGSHVGSSPTVSNGVIYVGSFDSNLYAFGLN
jgi:outer membrane protein assembly factor BamB